MFCIKAKGPVNIDGARFEDQKVIICGEGNTINHIEYGDGTLHYTIRALKELIQSPKSYYAVPEYPEPDTLKAAVVAINTLWEAQYIEVEGVILDDEAHAEGRIY